MTNVTWQWTIVIPTRKTMLSRYNGRLPHRGKNHDFTASRRHPRASPTLATRMLPLICFWLTALAPPPKIQVVSQHYAVRAPADWTTLDFDRAPWSQTLPRRQGIWYWACVIDVGDDLLPNDPPIGVGLNLLAAYEMYWDGKLIARNGVPGASIDSEKPGRMRTSFTLPHHLLTPGRHVLVGRMSSCRVPGRNPFYDLEIGDIRQLARWGLPKTIAFMSLLGAAVPVGLLFIGLYRLADRRREYLFFGLISLTFAVLLGLEFVKFVVAYSYDLHFPRLRAIVVLTLLLAGLIPLFFHALYETPLARRTYAGMVILSLLVAWFAPWYDTKGTVAVILALLYALVVSWFGARRHAPGARSLFVGLLIVLATLLLDNAGFHDTYFFLAFLGLILHVMGLLIMRFRAKNEEVLRTRLHAEQLRGELLRKQIHPHFLMNSLTAAIEYMEEEPARGIAMIESLSQAFRLMLDLVDQGQVSVARELELCRAHLATMNFIMAREMTIATEGLDLDRHIPPGVFLTLLENAVTHGRYQSDVPLLQLSEQFGENRLCYRFQSLLKKTGTGTRKGTGTQYIEARLCQAFGKRWSLRAFAQGEHWITELEVPRHAAHPGR